MPAAGVGAVVGVSVRSRICTWEKRWRKSRSGVGAGNLSEYGWRRSRGGIAAGKRDSLIFDNQMNRGERNPPITRTKRGEVEAQLLEEVGETLGWVVAECKSQSSQQTQADRLGPA